MPRAGTCLCGTVSMRVDAHRAALHRATEQKSITDGTGEVCPVEVKEDVMFEHALAMEYGRTNRTWTTVAGFAGQALLITGVVLAPLVGPQALPRPQSLVTLFYPSAPAAPPPPPAAQPAVAAPRTARTPLQIRAGQLTAPSRIPERPMILDEPPLTAAEMGGVEGGVAGGVEGGIPGGILHGLPGVVAAQTPPPAPVRPPAPPPEKPVPVQRITQGGNVQKGKLIHEVIPAYPILARQARISGTVELMGVIGTDGRIKQLQVLSGHPMLVQAALDAVRQWVYRPTHLNGNPVEVAAPITVTFVMNR